MTDNYDQIRVEGLKNEDHIMDNETINTPNINKHNMKYDDKIPTLNLFRERMLKVSTKNLHLIRDLLAQQPEILDDLRGVAADIILTRENTTTGDKVDHRIDQAKKMWNNVCSRINNMRKKEDK